MVTSPTGGGVVGGGGGLGQRLWSWLSELFNHALSVPPLSFAIDLFNQFRGAFQGKPPDATQTAIDAMGVVPLPPFLLTAILLKSLTGKSIPGQADSLLQEMNRMAADPTGYLSHKVQEAESSGAVQSAAAQIIAGLDAAVFQPLKATAQAAEAEPLALASAVMAAEAAVRLAAHTAGVAAEIASLGQVETVDSAITSILDSIHLDDIVRLSIEPIFSAAITPAAERFYADQFHPRRLSAQDLAVLIYRQAIDQGTYGAEGSKEGWRPEDLTRIQELARRRVQPGEALDARELGMIDDSTLVEVYKLAGMTDSDASFMAELATRQRHTIWSERLFTLALRQFANYKLDVTKLGDIGRAAGFSDERIQVETAVAQATLDSQIQDLSIAEIEAAYKANELGDAETVAYLDKIHIDPSGIPILLRTWKDSKTKGGARLNASRLEQAFHDGVISEQELGQKLRDLGWNSEDARLFVETAKWTKPAKPRELSEVIIITAFTDGVLSHAEAVSKLMALKFSEADANLILQVHTLRPATKQKTLSDATIGKLVKLGHLSETQAISRLVANGYTHDDASLVLAAETEKAPTPVRSKGAPSQGG